jgi:hypothetical protein
LCEETAGGWRSYTRTANQHCGPDDFAPDLHGLRGGPAGGSAPTLMQSRVAGLGAKTGYGGSFDIESKFCEGRCSN